MDFKIDWLTLTIKPEKGNTTYKEKLALDMEDCALDLCPLEKWVFDFLKLIKIRNSFRFKSGSVQHYNFMYTYNGIDIALANPKHFAEQGLMIRFSAQGIAYYEKYRKSFEKEWNWISFLKEFFSLGVYGLKCKCTRIDLAYDDISYDNNRLISLERINKAVDRGEAITLFRKLPNIGTNKNTPEITRVRERNSKGEILGETVSFGNRKSTVYLRFYDKLKEQLHQKQEVDEKIKHWVRMEFEFKRCRAMAVCDGLMLLSADEFGKYFAQVVNRYLRFIKPEGTREHYYRCKSRKWWRDIVGTVEKARLAENKAVKNRYKSSMRWLERTVFPTLWAVLNCTTIDKFLTKVREVGIEKSSYKHEEIIKDYISNKSEETRTGLENHKESTDVFEELVKELEKVARTNEMKARGRELCEILQLEEAFERFHRVRISGMYDKHIDEFKTRQMILYDELKAIDDVFNAFAR